MKQNNAMIRCTEASNPILMSHNGRQWSCELWTEYATKLNLH